MYFSLWGAMSKDDIGRQYFDEAVRLERLRSSAIMEIGGLIESKGIALGVPIEGRVKAWDSIEEKIHRKELALTHVRDLDDLVGIRIILLFRSDLEIVSNLIFENFDIVSSENTGERLGDSQFGYQSQHIIAKISPAWLKVPSFSNLGDLKMELQVRTLAQHIWAAASHKLQYKNESSVPPPIRRAINRASALLETVDLEFDRVLSERRNYVESAHEVDEANSPLNVDSLARILTDELPPENRSEDERYAELLEDLVALSVATSEDLRQILKRQKGEMARSEAMLLKSKLSRARSNKAGSDRLRKGVFLTHIGLARSALRAEFGANRVDDIMLARQRASEARR